MASTHRATETTQTPPTSKNPTRTAGTTTGIAPPRTPRGLSRAIFIGLAFLLDSALTQCPSKCSCSSSTLGLAVSCGPGLTSFPSNVPATTESFSLGASHAGPGQTNSIPALGPSDFASFAARVAKIHVAYSGVRTLAPGTFSRLSRLVKLDLRGNALRSLARSAFTGLAGLRHLALTDNAGCLLASDVFDELTSLTTLELGGLGLTRLDNELTKLTSLRTLDLHGNGLVRLEYAPLANSNNLRYLDLRFNDLHGVARELKGVLSNLKSLNLDYNPWRCNCALTWLKSLPARFVAPSRGGGGGVVCDQPANLQFTDVVNVADVDMTCTPARVVSCTSQPARLVSSGHPVRIACHVVGDPYPTVTFTRPDGTNVSTILMTSTTGVANVSVPVSVYSRHHGTWTVIADNGHGSSVTTIHVNIATTTARASTTTPTTTSTPTAATANTNTQPPAASSVNAGTGVVTPQPTASPNSGHQQLQPSSSPLTTTTTMATHHSQPPPPPNKPTTTDSPSTSSGYDNVKIVLIAAASLSSCVFSTGTCICIVVVYKAKKRRVRIAVRRRSVYSNSRSNTDDFELSLQSPPPPPPPPPSKDTLYFIAD